MKTIDTMNYLENKYKSAKFDITETFNSRYEDAILMGQNTLIYCTGGNWVYSIDPESMNFAKALLKNIENGNHSLYSVICKIMKSRNFDDLIKILKK